MAKNNYKGAALVFASNRMDTFLGWTLNDKDSPCRAEKVSNLFIYFIVPRWQKQVLLIPPQRRGLRLSVFSVIKNYALTKEIIRGMYIYIRSIRLRSFNTSFRVEHVKRGDHCEFVKLNKLDETTWSVKDYLLLLGTAHINQEVRLLLLFFFS